MVLPRRIRVSGLALGLTVVLAACGGSAPGQDGGGGDGGATPLPIAKNYTIKPGDTTPFPLAKGTYRLAWTTTGCPSVDFVLTGDNGFSNEKPSKLPNSARIIVSVPDGNYTVSQNDSACAEWQVTIDKIG